MVLRDAADKAIKGMQMYQDLKRRERSKQFMTTRDKDIIEQFGANEEKLQKKRQEAKERSAYLASVASASAQSPEHRSEDRPAPTVLEKAEAQHMMFLIQVAGGDPNFKQPELSSDEKARMDKFRDDQAKVWAKLSDTPDSNKSPNISDEEQFPALPSGSRSISPPKASASGSAPASSASASRPKLAGEPARHDLELDHAIASSLQATIDEGRIDPEQLTEDQSLVLGKALPYSHRSGDRGASAPRAVPVAAPTTPTDWLGGAEPGPTVKAPPPGHEKATAKAAAASASNKAPPVANKASPAGHALGTPIGEHGGSTPLVIPKVNAKGYYMTPPEAVNPKGACYISPEERERIIAQRQPPVIDVFGALAAAGIDQGTPMPDPQPAQQQEDSESVHPSGFDAPMEELVSTHKAPPPGHGSPDDTSHRSEDRVKEPPKAKARAKSVHFAKESPPRRRPPPETGPMDVDEQQGAQLASETTSQPPAAAKRPAAAVTEAKTDAKTAKQQRREAAIQAKAMPIKMPPPAGPLPALKAMPTPPPAAKPKESSPPVPAKVLVEETSDRYACVTEIDPIAMRPSGDERVPFVGLTMEKLIERYPTNKGLDPKDRSGYRKQLNANDAFKKQEGDRFEAELQTKYVPYQRTMIQWYDVDEAMREAQRRRDENMPVWPCGTTGPRSEMSSEDHVHEVPSKSFGQCTNLYTGAMPGKDPAVFQNEHRDCEPHWVKATRRGQRSDAWTPLLIGECEGLMELMGIIALRYQTDRLSEDEKHLHLFYIGQRRDPPQHPGKPIPAPWDINGERADEPAIVSTVHKLFIILEFICSRRSQNKSLDRLWTEGNCGIMYMVLKQLVLNPELFETLDPTAARTDVDNNGKEYKNGCTKGWRENAVKEKGRECLRSIATGDSSGLFKPGRGKSSKRNRTNQDSIRRRSGDRCRIQCPLSGASMAGDKSTAEIMEDIFEPAIATTSGQHRCNTPVEHALQCTTWCHANFNDLVMTDRKTIRPITEKMRRATLQATFRLLSARNGIWLGPGNNELWHCDSAFNFRALQLLSAYDHGGGCRWSTTEEFGKGVHDFEKDNWHLQDNPNERAHHGKWWAHLIHHQNLMHILRWHTGNIAFSWTQIRA